MSAAGTALALTSCQPSLRRPKLAGPTVLWLPVPRYLGALHRLGTGKPDAVAMLSFTDPFHAEHDGDEQERAADATVARAFSAPAGCDCAPCEE